MFRRLFLIAVLALAAVLGSVAIDTPPAAEASADCSSFLQFSLTGLTVTGSISAFGSPTTINVDANEALTITVNAVSGSGTHWIIINGATVGSAAWGESITYVFPSTGHYSFNHTIQGNGVVDVSW
jgi:hypothetical protein